VRGTGADTGEAAFAAIAASASASVAQRISTAGVPVPFSNTMIFTAWLVPCLA
jgi:hypothetical protein